MKCQCILVLTSSYLSLLLNLYFFFFYSCFFLFICSFFSPCTSLFPFCKWVRNKLLLLFIPKRFIHLTQLISKISKSPLCRTLPFFIPYCMAFSNTVTSALVIKPLPLPNVFSQIDNNFEINKGDQSHMVKKLNNFSGSFC